MKLHKTSDVLSRQKKSGFGYPYQSEKWIEYKLNKAHPTLVCYLHSGPENLKKSRQKKLVKSNKFFL